MTSFEPLTRPDVWSASNTTTTVNYQLEADAETDLLCRVLNLFAMQYLIPLSVCVQRDDERLSIDIRIDGLTWHRAEVIAEKMRNLISVSSVDVTQVQRLVNVQGS